MSQTRPVRSEPNGRPRVLHVTSERGWRGGERQIFLLMRELDRLGVPQTLAAPAGSPLADLATGAGFRFTALHSSMTLHPVNLARIARVSRDGGPLVAHAHTSPALTLVATVRHVRPVAAVVYTRRTAFPARPSRKYHTAADVYVAVSAAAQQCLWSAGTPRHRVRRIPDAVDTEHLKVSASASLAEKRPSNAPVVVSVGHLSPEKGHRVLLEAWPAVVARVPGARLRIAGDGPERAAMEALVAHLGLGSSVELLGFREQIGNVLADADVFVMPSLEEGLGSAALEAMGMALPVVASRAGGLSEVVADGHTGLLVPPGESQPLAEAVARLLEEPETREAMGAAGLLRVTREFSADRMAAAYLRLYREVIQPR